MTGGFVTRRLALVKALNTYEMFSLHAKNRVHSAKFKHEVVLVISA